MTPILIRHIPRPVHKLSCHQQRADALRCIRLDKLRRAAFEDYTTESMNNPVTPGLAAWGGPCHKAWHHAFNRYSEAYSAYERQYGTTPPATVFGVYEGGK